MSRRSLNAAVVLGALALRACSVYSPSDLVGNDTSFGEGGLGGIGRGGSSGALASGGSAARAGTGTGGFLSGGSGGSTGKATGGTGGASSGGGSAATSSGGSSPPGGGGGSSTGGKGSPIGGEDAGGAGGSGESGGMGGSGGTGGSVVASGGGSPTTGGAATGGTPPLAPELIDDMEDGNQNLLLNDNRNGAWYTAAGKGGVAEPVPGKAFSMTEIVGTPGAAGSTHAMHFSGSGGTEWGVMAAFDFNAATAQKVAYDATAYKGITFWIKATAAASIAVRIPIKATSEAAMGACTAMTNGCENHFSAPLALTTSWKQVTLLWAAFKQDASWGFQTTFAPAQLVSVQFVISSAIAPATPPSADFLIDDISFVL